MESAACVDCGWHAAAVVGVVATIAAGGGSSGSGADYGTVVAEAVVAAVVAIGALRVSDCHCGLGTAAFAVEIPGWKQKTSATLAKGAVVAAVAVAGYCRLSRWACPGASTSVASAGPDGVASDSRECYRRAFPVADDHRASAVDLVVAAELAAEHPCYSGDVRLPGGDGAAAVAALVAGCAAAAAVDVRQSGRPSFAVAAAVAG